MEQFVCGSFQPASPLSISLHLITSLSGNLHPAPVSVSFLPVAELARLRAIGHHISIAPCLAQPLNSPQVPEVGLLTPSQFLLFHLILRSLLYCGDLVNLFFQ